MDFPMMEEPKDLDLTLAKIAQDHFYEQKNNMISTEDIIAKSCSKEEIPIAGEIYVNKDITKKKSYFSRLKQGLLVASALVVVAGTLYVGNVLDNASNYRQEINQTISKNNPIGGKMVEDYIYQDDFVDYVNNLNDIELLDWANNIKKNMRNQELDTEKIANIVSEMQNDYFENIPMKGEK